MNAATGFPSVRTEAIIYVRDKTSKMRKLRVDCCRAYASLKNYDVSKVFVDNGRNMQLRGLTEAFNFMNTRHACVLIADAMPSGVGYGSEAHAILSTTNSRLELITLHQMGTDLLSSGRGHHRLFFDVVVHSFENTPLMRIH